MGRDFGSYRGIANSGSKFESMGVPGPTSELTRSGTTDPYVRNGCMSFDDDDDSVRSTLTTNALTLRERRWRTPKSSLRIIWYRFPGGFNLGPDAPLPVWDWGGEP